MGVWEWRLSRRQGRTCCRLAELVRAAKLNHARLTSTISQIY